MYLRKRIALQHSLVTLFNTLAQIKNNEPQSLCRNLDPDESISNQTEIN